MARLTARDHVEVTKKLKIRMASFKETHQMWLPGLLTFTTPDLDWVAYDHFGPDSALSARWKQEGLGYVQYHCKLQRPRLSRFLERPYAAANWHPLPTVRTNDVAMGYFSDAAALTSEDSEGYNFGEFYLVAHLRALGELTKESAIRILMLSGNTVFSALADKRLTFLD